MKMRVAFAKTMKTWSRRARRPPGGKTLHRWFRGRVLRIKATPHAVAAGLASGAACSFTPFIGFHFLMSFALARLLGGSLIAAALGTIVGNPLTFPFIFASGYALGAAALPPDVSRNADGAASLMSGPEWWSWESLGSTFVVTAAGSLPLAVVAYLVVYHVCRPVVARAQARRARRTRRVRAARVPAISR